MYVTQSVSAPRYVTCSSYCFCYLLTDNLPLIVFTDPVSDVTDDVIDAVSVAAARRHFRHLSVDALNSSILYAGAV